jgi:hypothetical protein
MALFFRYRSFDKIEFSLSYPLISHLILYLPGQPSELAPQLKIAGSICRPMPRAASQQLSYFCCEL